MRIFQMYFNALLQPMRHVTALCVLCLLLATGTARAQAVFIVNGITYQKLTASTVQVGNGSNLAITDGRTTLNIPETVSYSGKSYTVTGIGHFAFRQCSALTSLTLPASVTSIGDYAFSECAGVTSLTLPASLTSLGNYTFSGCSGLPTLTLPVSLTNIGSSTFAWCSSLTAFSVPSENTAFCALDGVLFSKDKTRLFSYPKNKTGSYYVVPAGVTSLESAAFEACSRLTSVSLPSTLTSIGDWAFYECTGLGSVTFPASVKSIGVGAFSDCYNLTSFTFPISLTSIGSDAFAGCFRLTSVSLPASLASIGNSAFCSCSNLTSIRYFGAKEPVIASMTFTSGPATRTLYVPNATGGFTASKWGATSIEYGTGGFGSVGASITGPSSALWKIVGVSEWTASNATLPKIAVGTYLVEFSDVSGWKTPNSVYVVVPMDGAAVVTGTYTSLTGSLRATLAPEEAVTAGAQWSIDGGTTWNNSGITLSGLNPGEKNVTYKPIDGWSKPNDTSVTIVAGQTATPIGTYTSLTGALRVTLAPEAAVTAGAQWSIDGGTSWNDSGVTLRGLNPGAKTVTYKPLPGWMKPNSSSVTVVAGGTATATGTYTLFDIELIDGDFTAGTVTPVVPETAIDISWTIQSTVAKRTPFWCEVFASKTGGFDQVRFGSTVTNSYSAAGTMGTTQTITPKNQILKTLPDGAYSLMPVVNRYATRTMNESDYVNNWTTIAGKRLRVHTTEFPSSDLMMSLVNISVGSSDPEQVIITGIVRNTGAKTLPADGCWIEAFYGYLSAEATLDPLDTVGTGFNLKNLDPGQETSFSLTGRVPGGAANFAIATIVDSTDIIPESNEVNNSKLWYYQGVLPTPPQNGIDLAVTNVALNPAQTAPHPLAPATLFNCSVTVQNNGTVDAGPVWIELFGSRDGGVSFVRGATLTDSLYEPAPAPGESKTYSFANMPVNAIGDGMYTIVAVVNRAAAAGNPGDQNPSNNRYKYAGGRITLSTPTQPGTVNLVWSEGPTFTETSGTMTVTGKVKNVGAVASKAFWTEAFTGDLDEHMGFFTRDSNVFAGGVLCEGLAPDAEQSITISGRVAPGKTVGILTDSTDLIAETDETDNYDYSHLYY